MMALRRVTLLIMISSFKLSRGSLVLPRPPSSPNEIEDNEGRPNISGIRKIFEDSKFYNEKLPTIIYHQDHNRQRLEAGGGSGSSTNVEKPNTDGYKLLEIELSGRTGGGNGDGAINFGDILREVFKNEAEEQEQEQEQEEGKNIRNKISALKTSKNDKKLNNYPEKFYYLKKQQGFKTIIPTTNFSNIRKNTYNNNLSARKTIYHGAKNYHHQLKNLGINQNENHNDDNTRPQLLEIVEDYPDGNYPRANYATAEFHTTENSLPTSSELPKQIPPPPSRVPSITIFSHTTPVLKFMSRRTDILPGY